MTFWFIMALAVCWLLRTLWRTARKSQTGATLTFLPGPRSASWIYGNLLQIYHVGNARMQEVWAAQYGRAFKYNGWLNTECLCTMDVKALTHILSHVADYHKPELARFRISEVIGEGLIVAEGEAHRRQRRVLNSAFGTPQLRGFTQLFREKSELLRDVWVAEIATHGESVRIDIFGGLAKMTLDVMGSAAFNQELNILRPGEETSELSAAFQAIFGPPTGKPHIFTLLKYMIPPLRYLPTERTRRIARAKATFYRVGMQLITERMASIHPVTRDGKIGGNLDAIADRDILTLLLKANIAADIPAKQRLSNDEVLAQIPSFLTAGYETTSNAAMWTIYALTQAPRVEQKLVEELQAVPHDWPTMDQLQALRYLDVVVRESLRLHAPVPSTLRVATKDDVIPLNDPFVNTEGKLCDHIHIPKGTTIDVPILALNRAKFLWGEDALEFRPERWDALPPAVQGIPGVWSDMMTFIGGPRSCIGYRFAVLEIKALIFILFRAFDFKLAVPREDLIIRSTVVQRPIVRNELDKGVQMPMLITRRRT